MFTLIITITLTKAAVAGIATGVAAGAYNALKDR
jgi:hypothetical protein